MFNKTPLLTIFQLYRGCQFYWYRKTTDLPQVTDHHSMRRTYKKNHRRLQVLSFHYLRGFNMLSTSFRYLTTASLSSLFIENSVTVTVNLPAKQAYKNNQIKVILRFVKTFLSSKSVLESS
jgi:hypothetical protein